MLPRGEGRRPAAVQAAWQGKAHSQPGALRGCAALDRPARIRLRVALLAPPPRLHPPKPHPFVIAPPLTCCNAGRCTSPRCPGPAFQTTAVSWTSHTPCWWVVSARQLSRVLGGPMPLPGACTPHVLAHLRAPLLGADRRPACCSKLAHKPCASPYPTPAAALAGVHAQARGRPQGRQGGWCSLACAHKQGS